MMLTQIQFETKLTCMECQKSFPMDSILYRCTSCNGLLSVDHNMDALKQIKAAEWKELFISRYRSSEYPYASGVWGKKEWVLPNIPPELVISLGEGATPLISVPAMARKINVASLYVKQCGVSHTGSFKDLGMTVLVSHVNHLIHSGKKIRAVACASTGDTSAALAAYAATAGIPTIVFLPANKISLAQLIQPVSNGSIVLSLDTDFDGCMKIVREITANDSSIYLANSMNPLRIEGQKSISMEIVQQLGWQLPDWVVIPGGNLGNVSALGAGFRMLYETGVIDRLPRICTAQTHHANPLYLAYKNDYKEYKAVTAKPTLASAIQIGDPVSYPRAVRTLKEFNGVVEEATEDELSHAAALGDRYGLFNDPHTGVALAATMKLAERNEIKATDRVVVISTAHGLKFTEFKTGYHKSSLHHVNARLKNEPVVLPADLQSVKAALLEKLEQYDSGRETR